MTRPTPAVVANRPLGAMHGGRTLIVLAVMLASPPVAAQTVDEHASHHPGGSAGASMPAPGNGMAASQPMGSPGADPMAVMMKQMMAPAPGATGAAGMSGMGGAASPPAGCCGPAGGKPFYPSLMQWPVLTDEAQRTVRAEALKRVGSGAEALTAEQSRLHQALASNDFVAARDAIRGAREGLALADSGAGAIQGMAEGKAPREIALTWFKTQSGTVGADKMAADSGLSWWHIIGMALLVAAMLTALFLRQARLRRVASLVERLTPGSPGGQAATAAPTAPAPQAPVPATAPQASPSAQPAVQRPWKGVLRIKAIFDETSSVKTFRLMEANGGPVPFTFLPGQYATITSEIDGQKVRRSYTISSSPTQRDYIELTIKREQYGLESRHLHDHADTGDLLEISAPSGRFFFTGTEADGIVLIAGGVGITPMMSVLRSLTDRSYAHDIFLLYGVNTPADLIFREECDYLARRHPKLHVVYVVSKADGTEWQGPIGYMTADFIKGSVPDITKRRIHLCGPPPMMTAVKAALAELKVPSDQIKTEEFAPPKGGPVVDTEPAEPVAAPPPVIPIQAAPIPSAHATVTFSKSGKAGPLAPDQSVLEAAEAIGVTIDYDCRAGTCGRCKVQLQQGQVAMEVEDALAADEKADGIILACQAKSAGDLVVEA